jgi:hypothetical protein
MREQGCDDLILSAFSGFDVPLLMARSGFVVDSLPFISRIDGAAAHRDDATQVINRDWASVSRQ